MDTFTVLLQHPLLGTISETLHKDVEQWKRILGPVVDGLVPHASLLYRLLLGMIVVYGLYQVFIYMIVTLFQRMVGTVEPPGAYKSILKKKKKKEKVAVPDESRLSSIEEKDEPKTIVIGDPSIPFTGTDDFYTEYTDTR
jgi:hypothetical protein